MAMGENLTLKDKLIKKTTTKANKTDNANIASKTNINKTETEAKQKIPEAATSDTKKATFYVKKDLLQKLYNFAYWDRHSITDAFNMVLSAGLKEKNTRNIGK